MDNTKKENNFLSKCKTFFINIGKSLVKLWKYYTPYEKTWLISICTIGILLGIFFPEDASQPSWLRVVEIIVIIGGCSCELLLSKQSKWAFVVSFFLYDITQTIVYIANGFYISALFEVVFWMPILWISFYLWGKKIDDANKTLTVVKQVNYARDLAIFLGVLLASVLTGVLFTCIGGVFEGMSEYWYLDALANAFSVCNGLFLILRYREQWIPWIGVALVEAVLWILSGQFIMLVLSIGYLMNSLYGLIMWCKYIKAHPAQDNINANAVKNGAGDASAIALKNDAVGANAEVVNDGIVSTNEGENNLSDDKSNDANIQNSEAQSMATLQNLESVECTQTQDENSAQAQAESKNGVE